MNFLVEFSRRLCLNSSGDSRCVIFLDICCSDLSVCPVGAGYSSGVSYSQQLSCRLYTLGEKHTVLARPTLGTGDKVIDLVDEGSKERLVLSLKGVGEGGKGNISGFPNSNSHLTNQLLPLLADMREFRNLLVDIDIDIQKTSGILVDDALLLAIEKVQESSILLEFVLKCGYDLFEFLLDVHKFK